MTDQKGTLPVINKTLCTGCGACVAICPNGAITGEFPGHAISELCTRCAECEDICPMGAITVPFTIGWAES